MKKISNKLTKRLDLICPTRIGIGYEDVRKIEITPNLWEDIMECLISEKIDDQCIALFFIEALGSRLNSANAGFVSKVVEIIEKILKGNAIEAQRNCYRVLPMFKSFFPNYREIMITGLRCSDMTIRWTALGYYKTYCKFREVSLLEPFEYDDYITEIAMAGPCEYMLRNLALEKIESVLGVTFKKFENIKQLSGGTTVYWWDWSPYHKWKKNWLRKLIYWR